jgi:hypothetical protein
MLCPPMSEVIVVGRISTQLLNAYDYHKIALASHPGPAAICPARRLAPVTPTS